MGHTYRTFRTDALWGPRYQARLEKRTGGLPFTSCAVCGRDTSRQGRSQGVWVGGGGSLVVHPDDYDIGYLADDPGGGMGWFPVGAECIKRFPVEYRAANPYDDQANGV